MHNAITLIDKERILELIEERISEEMHEEDTDEKEDKDEEEEEDISPDAPESLNAHDEMNELEMLLIETEDSERKDLSEDGDDGSRESGSDQPSEAENKDSKKDGSDSTIRDMIKKLNRTFRTKQKTSRKKAIVDYLREEFFGNSQYGINISELFGYLNTRATTDIYKAFYNDENKDRIYNFTDESLGFKDFQNITRVTKLARYMGYGGQAEYCSHEQLDARTREKWHLIRNITHVFVLSMLRYETMFQ